MPVRIAPMIPCRRCFYCQHDQENVCANKQTMGYDHDGGLGEYVRIPASGVATGNLFAAREDLPLAPLARRTALLLHQRPASLPRGPR